MVPWESSSARIVYPFGVASNRPGLARRGSQDTIEPRQGHRKDVIDVCEDRSLTLSSEYSSQRIVKLEVSHDLGEIETQLRQSTTSVVDAGEEVQDVQRASD